MNNTNVGKKEYLSPTVKAYRYAEEDIITTSGVRMSWDWEDCDFFS